MNAAIDQQCELYIANNELEANVVKQIYIERNEDRPHYQGDLPAGNNGLGLMLLGVTGIKFCL
jgi:methylmalonyl-CoA mutase